MRWVCASYRAHNTCTDPSTHQAIQNRSVERSFGVHRGLVAIAADVTRLLSDRLRTHRLYGMYTVPAPDDLLVHASSLAIEMTMAYGGLAAETEKLRQDLSSWHDSLQHDISAMSKRTEIGSLALWHACNILLVDGDGDGATAVAECEMRAREILELCARVGDKVEYMNWVCRFFDRSTALEARTDGHLVSLTATAHRILRPVPACRSRSFPRDTRRLPLPMLLRDRQDRRGCGGVLEENGRGRGAG